MAQVLPQLLWDLGKSNPTASLSALKTLHNAARFCPAGGEIAVALDRIQAQIGALFVAVVSAEAALKLSQGKRRKGKKGRGDPGEGLGKSNALGGKVLVAGPLVNLPEECQVHFPVSVSGDLRITCYCKGNNHVCYYHALVVLVEESDVNGNACFLVFALHNVSKQHK